MSETQLIQIGEQRASSTSRWIACLGSAILCGGEVSSTDAFAAEGIVAHRLLEFCLRFGSDPADHVGDVERVDGDKVFEVIVTDEMAESVAVAVDWTRENLPDFVAEVKMDGSGLGLPNWTGHVDIQGYDAEERELTVVDYKHGAGVRVTAFENAQALSYAAMAMASCGPVDSVRIVIIQPRVGDEPVDVWRTDFARLVRHVKDVSDATRVIEWLIDNPEAINDRLHPGAHCQFCPAILKCPAIHEPVKEVALSGFDNEGFLINLTPDEVAFWFANRKRVSKWMSTLEARARELADTGSLPGFKLVESLENRRWVDEEVAVENLVSLGINPDALTVQTPDAMLSPSKTESLPRPDGVKKKDLVALVNDLTHRPVRGLTIVPEDDKRQNKVIDAASEFDIEEEEE